LLRPGLGERLHLFAVPGAGETAAADLVAGEDVIVDRPFGPRHLIKHLDAVAVGVAQIDAERNAVVGDVLDRLTLRLDAVVEFLQVVERFEPPSHVIKADLAFLLQRRVVAQLHQRHLVRLLFVGRHEGSPAGPVFIDVQPEQLFVPLFRALDITHIDVDVLQIHRSLGHFVLPCAHA
jgi:hypothetical protein